MGRLGPLGSIYADHHTGTARKPARSVPDRARTLFSVAVLKYNACCAALCCNIQGASSCGRFTPEIARISDDRDGSRTGISRRGIFMDRTHTCAEDLGRLQNQGGDAAVVRDPARRNGPRRRCSCVVVTPCGSGMPMG